MVIVAVGALVCLLDSPVFEEPERARRILLEDVLTGANRLADKS